MECREPLWLDMAPGRRVLHPVTYGDTTRPKIVPPLLYVPWKHETQPQNEPSVAGQVLATLFTPHTPITVGIGRSVGVYISAPFPVGTSVIRD
jgi:hypothetical protein